MMSLQERIAELKKKLEDHEIRIKILEKLKKNV
jgi:hypothetical protein